MRLVSFFSIAQKTRFRIAYRSNLCLRIIVHCANLIFRGFIQKTSILCPGIQFYDNYIVILSRFSLLLWPVYIFIKRKNLLVSINNIGYATGHIYPEIDFLNRKLTFDLQYANKVAIYCYPRCGAFNGISQLLSSDKVNVIESGLLHLFLYPLAIRYPDIAIDCAQSNVNHCVKNGRKVPNLSFMDTFRVRQVSYAKCRTSLPTFFPLSTRSKLNRNLFNLVGSGEYVVIQIKDVSVNATYNPVNPSTYCKAITYLQAQGFKVVFAGREALPNVFKSLDVINYSESVIASPFNDYLLINNASMVLASASGFCYIPECLGIPLLSINNWQLNGYPGQKTIQIPSLVEYKGNLLDFKSQMNFFYHHGQITPDSVLLEDVNVHDCDQEQVYQAIRELQKLDSCDFSMPLTDLQLRFNNLFPLDLPGNGLSRISDFFLQEHQSLI